jgi:hypothetical protein
LGVRLRCKVRVAGSLELAEEDRREGNVDYALGQLEDWFVPVKGKTPVTTPAGTPVVTHHRELAEQIVRDVSATGTDPTARTNMFALQAAYLDFGLTVPRAQLDIPILDQWRSDLYVNRPADPELMMPLTELWGPVPFGHDEFVKKVRATTLRQLMVLMQCGAQYGSAVLGLQVLNTDRDPTGFALGACARFWAYLTRNFTLENGYLNFGASVSARHDPANTDDEYCDEQCCSEDGPDNRMANRCPMHQVLVTMRRWAAFPEEILA